jgi:hypothetical protein
MRPRFLIFILIVVLLMVALLLWRRPVPPSANTEKLSAAVQSNSPAAPLIGQPTLQAKPPSDVVTNSEARRQAILGQIIAQKNIPVDFYGLVIDQDSNPIPDVKIKSSVRHWKASDPNFGIIGADQIPLEATTGADGRFELTGASGDVFGVLLTKDGYDAEPGNSGFGAGSYSYANPVVFKMWSTNIHEKLITGKYAFKIVPDGRSYYINLTEGTISESGTGDLNVWIQYTNQIKDSRLYNWSAGINVINGGLQDATDSSMWAAPASGYIPSFINAGQIKGYQTGDTEERHFYLQLKNRQEYGQMSIELIAPYNFGIPGLVRLSYVINPSGSRILR